MKLLTDEKVLSDEIEALENAINNPSDRSDYLCDFWSNADLLLKALKMKDVKELYKAS